MEDRSLARTAFHSQPRQRAGLESLLLQRVTLTEPSDLETWVPAQQTARAYTHMCKNMHRQKNLGDSISRASNFGSGHGLTVHEFEPRVGLCADSSKPGACFGFCVPLSLCPSPLFALCLSLSLKNQH